MGVQPNSRLATLCSFLDAHTLLPLIKPKKIPIRLVISTSKSKSQTIPLGKILLFGLKQT